MEMRGRAGAKYASLPVIALNHHQDELVTQPDILSAVAWHAERVQSIFSGLPVTTACDSLRENGLVTPP